MARPLHDRHGFPRGGSAEGDLRDARPYTYLPDYIQEYCLEMAATGPLLQRALSLRSTDDLIPDPTR
eukprot:10688294-Alexandrium_andersonii.AAC.1